METTSFTKDEHAAIDAHFDQMYSMMTLDQISVTTADALLASRPDDWYKDKIIQECNRLNKLHRAYIQFPSMAADGITAVKYNAVRKIHNDYDRALVALRKMIADASDNKDGTNRYSFEVEMRNTMTNTIELGTAANIEWWNSVKYDMCPPAILKDQIETAHSNGLLMNQQFDIDTQIEQALSTLSPSHRKFLEPRIRS